MMSKVFWEEVIAQLHLRAQDKWCYDTRLILDRNAYSGPLVEMLGEMTGEANHIANEVARKHGIVLRSSCIGTTICKNYRSFPTDRIAMFSAIMPDLSWHPLVNIPIIYKKKFTVDDMIRQGSCR